MPNVVLTSLNAGYLYLSFFQFASYLSLLLSVISKTLAQPCCKCCNLSVSVVVNVRFTTNAICAKNNTSVANLLLRKSTRFHYKKNNGFTKKH